jgi:hypothetical protein
MSNRFLEILIFIKNNLMTAGMVKVPIKPKHVPNVVLKDVNLMGTHWEQQTIIEFDICSH